MSDEALRARVRAACCSFHGLGASSFEAHVEGIVAVVIAARERDARALARERKRAQDRARVGRRKALA